MIEEQNKKIWTINNKKELILLRKVLADFDFTKHAKKEIEELVIFMRKKMIESNGIGLAANQIGLDMKLFVAQLPDRETDGYKGKFYAIFNPKITKKSEQKNLDNEGCLSVPGFYGKVERFSKITINGLDKNNKKIEISVSGFLARIFQHEIDHINGKLFIDSAKEIFKTIEDKKEYKNNLITNK